MKDLIRSAALAGALAFTPFMAFAATCSVGDCNVDGTDGQHLSDGISFKVKEITNDADTGAFKFATRFINDTTAPFAKFAVSVLQFQPTSFGYIENLVLNVFEAEKSPLNVAISDASGNPINPVGNDVLAEFTLAGSPSGSIVNVELEGVAVEGRGFDPYVIMQITPVPVPAGGLLLLSALGMGFLARRRKMANA